MGPKKPALAIDETIALEINDSQQWVRLCAARPGLPLVVVQHGPGVPVLHEVAKFQRRLDFERDYLVVYRERGCGNAPADEARGASLAQQVEDLQAVLRWVADRTQQGVLVFGISLGATISLLVAEREGARVKAVVANSPDLQTRAGDAAADTFLREHVLRAGTRRLQRALTKLGPPPYLDPRAFQRRAVLLADFDSIERGRASGAFGEQDALTAAFMSSELPGAIGGPRTTAVRVPDAGHMVHFDRPRYRAIYHGEGMKIYARRTGFDGPPARTPAQVESSVNCRDYNCRDGGRPREIRHRSGENSVQAKTLTGPGGPDLRHGEEADDIFSAAG
jgi:pimeloyl-ACP methyl ester carboxylesterase